MGLLQIGTIKNEILAHHANRSDISSRLNTVIDLAQIRIARLHDWDQLKFTLNSNLAVTASKINDKIVNLDALMPTGRRLKTLYSVRVLSADGRSNKLSGKTATQFDDEIPEPEFYERGYPEWYTVFASVNEAGTTRSNPSLELWRVPDVAYDIALRMQVWPRFLSDDVIDDDSVSDLWLDDGIIHLSTSYLYYSQGREDKARQHYDLYAEVVKAALHLDETDFHTLIAGVKISDGLRMGDYVSNPFIRDVP